VPPPAAAPAYAPSPREAKEQAPAEADASHREAERDHPLVLRLPVGTRLADAERKLILLTLEAVRGNKQRAARVLGISRRGLYSKLQAYGEHVGSQEPTDATDATDATEEPSSVADPPSLSSEEMPQV
jgi:DNA-binding NtrC family response regulator